MTKKTLKYASKCKYIDNYDLEYAKKDDVGFDLRADIKEPVCPTETVLKIPTGIYLDIPDGYEVQIRSRSGLATKGIFVVNSPGTIDTGYVGEIIAIVTGIKQQGANKLSINPNDKICQAVLKRVDYAKFEKVENINKETERGSTGFGSTDKKEKK